ncbi:MAG: isochorismatase family protein [Planctomycetaceae bacterium]
MRSPEQLSRAHSRLLIIDMQVRLLASVPQAEEVTTRCGLLVRGAQLLGVPVSVTEQYPRGLGPTVPALIDLLPERVEKLRFSSAASFEWSQSAGDGDRPQVVVAGIETHVCVQQTVLDLLASGFVVAVVADAVASRRERDAATALQRMRDSGAVVTTAESVLFEWCETAAAAEFKALSLLVKEQPR